MFSELVLSSPKLFNLILYEATQLEYILYSISLQLLLRWLLQIKWSMGELLSIFIYMYLCLQQLILTVVI